MSDTEYQVLAALDLAGKNGLSINALCDAVDAWKDGADEGTNRSEQAVGLDALASFFGTTRKNGDGALFHKKFFGSETERSEAISYLYNDIIMTVEIAEKLGVIR